jgi:hypothetical protein
MFQLFEDLKNNLAKFYPEIAQSAYALERKELEIYLTVWRRSTRLRPCMSMTRNMVLNSVTTKNTYGSYHYQNNNYFGDEKLTELTTPIVTLID